MRPTARLHLVLVLGIGLLCGSAWSLHALLFSPRSTYDTLLSPVGGYLVIDKAAGAALIHVPSKTVVHQWDRNIPLTAPVFSIDETVICWREADGVWRGALAPSGLKGVRSVAPVGLSFYAPRLSPDGSKIALPCSTGLLIMYDAHDGAELWRVERPGNDLDDAAFSGDGELVAATRTTSASRHSVVEVFDAGDGTPRSLIEPGQDRSARGLRFRPGSRELWTNLSANPRGWNSGPPYLAWDLADPGLPRVFAQPDVGHSSMHRFAPGGDLIAAPGIGPRGGEIEIIKLAQGSTVSVATFRPAWLDYRSSIAFSGDGRSLLIAQASGRVESFDIATQRLTDLGPGFGEAVVRWWHPSMLGVAVALSLAWLYVPGPLFGADREANTPDGWGASLVAAVLMFGVAILCHLYAIANAIHADFTVISTMGLLMLLLFGTGVLGIVRGVSRKRWRIGVLAAFGLLLPSVIFGMRWAEYVASV